MTGMKEGECSSACLLSDKFEETALRDLRRFQKPCLVLAEAYFSHIDCFCKPSLLFFYFSFCLLATALESMWRQHAKESKN